MGRPARPSTPETSLWQTNTSARFGLLTEMFQDNHVKCNLSVDDLYKYVNVLNEAVYSNRYSRLNESRNRDSDSYQNHTLSNDIWLKNAILDLADNLSHGPLRSLVQPQTLRKLLYAMLQLQVYPEMIKFWENGVNDPKQSSKYLKQSVLAVILPLTYSEKRFSYDQIIKLYEVNTKQMPHIIHGLSGSIGKIAIQEGDYSRALDCLELVLAYLESGKDKESTVHRTLAELHAAFIGECKDIKIAKHFFNKTIENQLPYNVPLKAPRIQSLMEHCVEANEPFETIFDVWKHTLTVYARDSKNIMNARYSILNKAFCSIFFTMYPTLTEEGYAKLKEIIATYANIKAVDDIFLNNLISSYTWDDKVVFDQLVDNYAVYNVSETAVSYRVILKKMGGIKDFTNADILKRWNTTLHFLDGSGYSYIPIADWASLREATILSPYASTRTEFYLAVLNAYKNYHQDDKAVVRFVKNWFPRPQMKSIALVSSTPTPTFNTDVDVKIPSFQNLKENVDYNKVASNLVASSRDDNDKKSAMV
ncbi:hypothetical protein JCM33374_g2280 [Metschnikowia sp. JCM 33374]|nr:hypothetical protein JCM33374_g2280 [Metschnikowia sp. JCM 33374]